MNTLHPQRFIVPALALSLAFTIARAQDKTDPYKKSDPKATSATSPAEKQDKPEAPDANNAYQLQITSEWIEMKTEDAMVLLRGDVAPNNPEIIQKIRDMEKKGEATLVDMSSVVTRSGQRATVEGNKEHIYPTEYEPLRPPNLKRLDLSNNQIREQRVEVASESHSSQQPRAFTMRQLGAKMEVDPVLGPDGRTIDLNLAPEMVRFVGTLPYGTVRVGGENVPLNEQPLFVSSKAMTAITLRSGQTLIAAAMTPHNSDGEPDPTKKLLLLIHAVAFPLN